MVKHLRESQQHTAISHMNSSSTLVAKFFRTTPASETYENHAKLTVLAVKDGASIRAEDYPVYADMTKPVKGVCSVRRKLSPNVGSKRKCHQNFNTSLCAMCQQHLLGQYSRNSDGWPSSVVKQHYLQHYKHY